MAKKSQPQSFTRKQFVSTLAAMPLAWMDPLSSVSATVTSVLPAKEAFEIKGIYLNAAYTHPMSKGSYQEVQQFLNQRLMNGRTPPGYDGFDRSFAQKQFAKLINATEEEIAWVPSTMVGENLIVSGLGIPRSQMKVVTDAYHFHGSLHMYGQLAREGLDLVVVKPANNEIRMEDLDKAIKPGTSLVAVSLVSATTGFQHDLKTICDLAHSRGAMVYADIIQAAGAVPIDVKASQVDFCACSTYKWLMGDFGIGFLYVRKDLIPKMHRTLIGFRQIDTFQSHFLPYDPPGEKVFESKALSNISGHFEVGTFANEGIVALRYSLEYLNNLGIENIQRYRQPMIEYLQDNVPDGKFKALTPRNSRSPIVCFAYKNADRILQPRLNQAGINIQVYENYIRISPSLYNDIKEIESLVEVLKGRGL